MTLCRVLTTTAKCSRIVRRGEDTRRRTLRPHESEEHPPTNPPKLPAHSKCSLDLEHTNRIVKGPFRRRDRSYSPNTVMVHKLLFFLIDLLSPYQASSPALVPLCAALDQAGNRLLDLLVRQTCALLAPGSPNWISRKSLLTLQGLALLNTELCIAQQHPSAIPSSFGDLVEGAVLTVSRVNLG